MTQQIRSERHELFIRTTPEALWAALTEAELTTRYFFGTAVESRLERGAPFVYRMPDGALASDGEVLAAEAPRRLSHTWVVRYDPSLSHERSTVTYEIEPRGAACKLTLTHDLSSAPATAAHIERDSWSVILSGLKTLLETGAPLEIAPPA